MPRKREVFALFARFARIAAFGALLLLSCRADSPVRFPTRTPPTGYPAVSAEDLPGRYAVISAQDIQAALVNRQYRVRYGVLHLPDSDRAVDALSGAHGFRAEGPFERELSISAGDVYVSVFPAPIQSHGAPVHRLVACVDVRPSHLEWSGAGTPVVLDVQPVGHAPSVPLVLDAVTGESLAERATDLFDGTGGPCDRRILARLNWEENLRRVSRVRGR